MAHPMGVLIAGLVIFLSVHLVPVFAERRQVFVARVGAMPYRAIHSLIALVGLVLIIWGFGMAMEEGVPQLYFPPVWIRHLVMLIMLPVFVLLVAAYLPSPITTATRHPMVLAIKVWAFAHLLANGDLASVVLFGSFLVWGVVARISLKRRERAGLVTVRGGPASNAVIAVIVGLAIYGLFIWKAHMWLIGVPIL